MDKFLSKGQRKIKVNRKEKVYKEVNETQVSSYGTTIKKKMCLSYLVMVSYVGDGKLMHPKKGLRRLKVKDNNRD